jgi:hypothetical protein
MSDSYELRLVEKLDEVNHYYEKPTTVIAPKPLKKFTTGKRVIIREKSA